MQSSNSFLKTAGYTFLTLVAFLITPAFAIIEVDNGFDNGTRTSGSDPLAVSWYSMNGPGTDLAVVNDNGAGGIDSGNALQVTPSATAEGVVAQMPLPVTLKSGQSITFAFQWRFTGTTNENQANLFRFGLLDSRGTPTAPPSGTGDNDTNDRVDDFAYFAATNPGLASSSGTALYKSGNSTTGANAGLPVYGATLSAGASALGTAGASVNAGTTAHWASMVITRVGTSLTFSVTVDGQTTATATDTAPLTYTFDSIAIATGSGSLPSAFTIDNVQVDYSVIKANDGFDDGTRTSGTNPLKMNWYSLSGTSSGELSVPDDSAGIGSGFALKLAAASTFRGFMANLPSAVTLNDGDSVTLIFDWRFTNTTNLNQAARLRFGLFNSNGTKTTSDNNGTTRVDDCGYFGNSNPGLSSGTGTAIARETAPGTGGEITMGSTTTTVGTSGASVNGGTTPNYASLTLSRTGTTVSISISVDGQPAATYTDSTPLTYTYDELGFSIGSGSTPIPPLIVDNVRVEYSPGVPATWSPLGVFLGEAGYTSTWTTSYNTFTSDMGQPAATNPSFCDGGTLHGASNSMTSIAGFNASSQWANTTARNSIPIVSVPLANQSSNGNLGATKTDLSAIAAGTYDADYNLVFGAYGNWSMIYLRIGWEMDEPNYPWYCTGDTTEAANVDYVAAWKHVANLAHAYATAHGKVIKTVWCPAQMNYAFTFVSHTYPTDTGYTPGGTGDQYVDVIAADIYSPLYLSKEPDGTYWSWATNAEIASQTTWASYAINRAHWLDYPGSKRYFSNGQGAWNLAATVSMAQYHLKPLGLAETGGGNNGTTDGPADDPILPLWEASRLSAIVAQGIHIEFIDPWDLNSNGRNFAFTNGAKPNQLASWQQFIDTMTVIGNN